MSDIYLISYATEKFKHCQNDLHNCLNNNLMIHKKYSEKDIDNDYFEKHKNILIRPRGAGYWLWKPYLILKTLNNMKDNDFLIYVDCGDKIVGNLYDYAVNKMKQQDLIIFMNVHLNEMFCKKLCFNLMDCDTDFYKKSTQVEAGFCIIKKTIKNINFIKTWLKYCEDPRLITDDFIENENAIFRDHRHDQSILTNLVLKEKINTTPIQEIYSIIYMNANQP